MNIKKFLLLISLVPLSITSAPRPTPASNNGSDIEQTPFPAAFDAVTNQPVSRRDIEDMLNSEEFNNLAKELGITNISQEEKEALVQETLEFAQKPVDQQQKELEKMFKDMPIPPKPGPGTQEKIAPKTTQPVAPEPKKQIPTISKKQVNDIRTLAKKLAQNLENIEISFESLPRVSSDILIEQKWVEIKTELPFIVSAFRRLEKNNALLEQAASAEFKLLQTQMKDLYEELKDPAKKLSIPDSDKLTKLTPEERSRALTPSQLEKTASKESVTKIINILSRSLQNITYGTRKLYEKYAPKDLKDIEKALPQQNVPSSKNQESLPSEPRYRTNSYNNDSSYRPSYNPRYDDYTGSDYDYDNFDRNSPNKSKSASTASGLEKDKKKTYGADNTTDKSKKNDGSRDQKSVKKNKEQSAIQQNELDKLIDELDKKISDSLGHITATTQSIETLSPDKIEDKESLNKTRNAMQEINPLLTELSGMTGTWIQAEKGKNKEAKDSLKKKIAKYLDKKDSLQKLANLSSSLTKKNYPASIPADTTQVIRYFADFAKEYDRLMDQLHTTESLTKKIKEQQESLNSYIKKEGIIEPLKDAQHKKRTSEDFKKSLSTTLKLLDANLDNISKLLTLNPQAKTKELIVTGEAANLIKVLEDEKFIPQWAINDVKALTARIQQLI